MKQVIALALIQLACIAHALTAAEWRNQSIYFMLTDRYARTDNSTTAPCNVTAGEYCGGSWQGITQHLDYIQNMGYVSMFD